MIALLLACAPEPVGEDREGILPACDADAPPGTLYVVPGGDGDGSAAAPAGSLADAVAALDPDGTIRIAAGTYMEALFLDDVRRHRGVTIEGCGDARPTLAGWVEVSGRYEALLTGVTLRNLDLEVHAPFQLTYAGLTLEDVSLVTEQQALVGVGSELVTVGEVHIEHEGDSGFPMVVAGSDTSWTVDGHTTIRSAGDLFATGVSLSSTRLSLTPGASLEVAAGSVGVWADGVSELALEGGAALRLSSSPVGLVLNGGAHAVMDPGSELVAGPLEPDATFAETVGLALGGTAQLDVASGADVALSGLERGVELLGRAELAVDGSLVVEDATDLGIALLENGAFTAGPGSTLTVSTSSDAVFRPLHCEESARVQLDGGARLTAAAGTDWVVWAEGACEIEVGGSLEAAGASSGAIYVEGGLEVGPEAVVLVGAPTEPEPVVAGIQLQGGRLDLHGALQLSAGPPDVSVFSVGLIGFDAARATLHPGARLAGDGFGVLLVGGGASSFEVQPGAHVEATGGAFGVYAAESAEITLDGDVSLTAGRPSPASELVGVAVEGDGEVHVGGNLTVALDGDAELDIGLIALGDGVIAVAGEVTVEGADLGAGAASEGNLRLEEGGRVDVRGARLGVQVLDGGTLDTAAGSTLTVADPDVEGQDTVAVWISGQGEATLAGSLAITDAEWALQLTEDAAWDSVAGTVRVDGSEAYAVIAPATGALRLGQLDLVGCGGGLSVYDGAHLDLAGSTSVDGAVASGLVVRGGAQVEVTGSLDVVGTGADAVVIEDATLAATGPLTTADSAGAGLRATDAAVSLAGLEVRGAEGAGIRLERADAGLQGVVVEGVDPSDGAGGDGVTVVDPVGWTLDGFALSGHTRAGLLVSGGGGAVRTGSVAGGVYSLVWQACAGSLAIEGVDLDQAARWCEDGVWLEPSP